MFLVLISFLFAFVLQKQSEDVYCFLVVVAPAPMLFCFRFLSDCPRSRGSGHRNICVCAESVICFSGVFPVTAAGS